MNSKQTNTKYEGAKRSGFAPAFHTMTGKFSASLFLAVCSLFPQAIFPQAVAAQASDPESTAGEIRGAVTRINEQGDATALEGILVNLSAGSQKPAPSTLSDADGHFQFAGLSAGTYLLNVSQTGFKPFTAAIVLQPRESRVQDIRLELATVASSIDVQGDASEITAHSADPDTTLTERELPALPMAQQKFTEALPLIPGVVRTMNGVLNIKGEVANQGMLLVDAAQMVDPVTGGFSVGVPLTSVETLNVFEAPYNSQYGGFSGGLATIETKAPPSLWQYSLLDLVPGARVKKGHISGISAETPRLFLGGPLLRNRLNISESFDYTIKNTPVRGQPWPVNENRLRGFTSFTNLQAVLSPRHLLTASVTAFSSRSQFADINSLVPQSASSNSGSKGTFATVKEIDQFSSGTLNTTFRYTQFKSNAYGQGDQDLVMNPEGLSGNAFNRWTRTANQFEMLPAFEFARKTWHGSHDLKVGTDVVHGYYDGTNHSNPIEVRREDGSLAERIDFSGFNPLHGRETEVSEFVQDHWVLSDRLAVDSGFRLTAQSNGRSAAFAPRLGLVYSMGTERKTVLRAGAGFFYDRVPLLAATFPQNPTRMVTLYNQAGLAAGPPAVLQNAYLDFDGGRPTTRTSGDPGTSPRNFTWNVELEREVNSKATVKLSYLQSQVSDLYVVAPWGEGTNGDSVLGLSHTGNSRYRELQAGVRYRLGQRGNLNVTYLHSQAKGSLNTLSNTYAPFEQPIIRPNVNDYLPSDIPDRLLSSGVFQLPRGFTISPVVDLHTGFRYSNVDVLNNYVGRPNSQRFPTYFSLDMKVYRDFKLPTFAARLKDHRLRIGIYALDVTNRQNPHDVYNNIASPVFGHLVGFQHRVTGMLIDIVK
jgi:hypothetical protein